MVRHDGDRSRSTFAILEIVGRGGALLRSAEPVPVESEAELAICLAGGVIRARARVLYHLRDPEGLGIGVEFLDLSPSGSELLEQLVEDGSNPLEPPGV